MGTIILSDLLEALGPFTPDRTAAGIRAAQGRWEAFQRTMGLAGHASWVGANGKLAKGSGTTVGVTLAASDIAGVLTCKRQTVECRTACILDHGRSRWDAVRAARIAKTRFLHIAPRDAITLIADAVLTRDGRPRKIDGKRIGAVRLNVASDLRWERIAPDLLALFADAGIGTYDYTKYPPAERKPIHGYRLTYSYAGKRTDRHVEDALAAGMNVAVVLAAPRHGLPATWRGIPVIDGDVIDDRTQDPHGVIVGLAAKGDLVGQLGTADGFLQAA